jgi:hypothetical protein
MVEPYNVEGDSFRSEKPQALSVASRFRRPSLAAGGIIDLHPDSRRFAVAPLPAAPGEGAKQNKLVFVFNFFDELRRVAPPAN